MRRRCGLIGNFCHLLFESFLPLERADPPGGHVTEQFQGQRIDKILTLEVSGIVPALLAARELGVPMVYARKGRRVTQKECFEAPVKSRTTDVDTIITVDTRMLRAGEQVLIVDDFLARGEAVAGIASIVEQAGAKLLGVYCVFEKTFEGGRERLNHLKVPVLSFIRLTIQGDDLLVEEGIELESVISKG